MYDALPPEIKRQARQAYRQFQENPFHPSLRFHELRGYPGYWSARVTLSYRAVCRREGDTVYWFWIGSHADFDRDFA
jgi:hypothetical protein